MKVFLAVINLVILYANADTTVDLGPVQLASSIGKLHPLYNPLKPDDVKATKNFKDHVEWLRPQFPTGHGYMPPLDPYQIQSIHPIPIHKGLVKGYVVLTNLRIDGPQKFSLNNAEVRMGIDTVNGVVNLPNIVGNVDFNVQITVGILPLTIRGHLQAILTGVKLAGVLGSTATPMNNVEVFQITADDVKLTADNLKVTLSHMSVEATQGIVKEWWGKLKDDIAILTNTAMVTQVNEVINHYTTQQVRDFLLQ